MRLLHPIVPPDGHDCVRVLAITRNYTRRTLYGSGALARSYLETVCDAKLRLTICDSAAANDTLALSLPSALRRIQAGEFDLVISSDLSQVTRVSVQLLQFLRCCREHRVRFIAFEDHVDTAEDDCDPRIHSILADLAAAEDTSS